MSRLTKILWGATLPLRGAFKLAGDILEEPAYNRRQADDQAKMAFVVIGLAIGAYAFVGYEAYKGGEWAYNKGKEYVQHVLAEPPKPSVSDTQVEQ